jgi:hypothetical protein
MERKICGSGASHALIITLTIGDPILSDSETQMPGVKIASPDYSLAAAIEE